MKEPPVVGSWLPRPGRTVVAGLAVAYLAVLAQSTSWRGLDRVIPAWARFFTSVACLFPEAEAMSIDYRIEAHVCGPDRFEELDYRRYFPMRPDDKENRLQRLGHFYRHNRRVMAQLDAYLVAHHNAHPADAGDGIDGGIGGIRFLDLRIPNPPPGGAIERYRRRPLADYPAAWRHVFYQTPRALRERRCTGGAP